MTAIETPINHHKRGWTVATFGTLGENILSTGVDGKVRVLDGIADSSPMEHILATDSSYVHILNIEDGLPEGIATRFTAEVNDLSLSKDGSRLAACKDENRETVFKGHEGAVLSVSIDPLDIFVASASCDGTVRLWNIEHRSSVRVIHSVAKCNDASIAPSPCRMSWEASNGKFLAVPVDKEVRLYERHSWEVLCSLTCPLISKQVTVSSCSPDGGLLAAGCGDGFMIIWRVEDRSAIQCVRDPSQYSICSLSWHPLRNSQLLYANLGGFLGLVRVPQVVKSSEGLSPSAITALLGCDEEGDTDELLRVAAAQAESSRLMIKDDAAEQAADDAVASDNDADMIDLSRIKSVYANELDDDYENVLGGAVDAEPAPGARASKLERTAVPTEAIQTALLKRLQKPFQPGSMPLAFRERFMVWNRVGVVTQYRGSDDGDANGDQQAPKDNFTSGSIEVDFHDAFLHHGLRLSNTVGYTMADLSTCALLLASPGSNDPDDDDDAKDPNETAAASKISVLPLSTSASGAGDSSCEWSARLPAGEACQCVCLVPGVSPLDSNHQRPGYAVVVTSRNLLRVFAQPTASAALLRSSTSLNLLQLTHLGLPPISVPGCGVVTLTSHPFLPILAVVLSSPIGELQWRLYFLGGKALGDQRTPNPVWLNGSLSTWQPLPLTFSPDLSPSASRLTWLGFSDLGALYTHDAVGTVRRLLHTRSDNSCDYHWAPVCDTRALLKQGNRRSDAYFIVGIRDAAPEDVPSIGEGREPVKTTGLFGLLEAIYCKASKWPRVLPRPVVSNISFRLPLCGGDTDQTELEENSLRTLVTTNWPVWGPNSTGILDADMQEVEQALASMDFLTDNCSTKHKATLLRLFALAVKMESDWASLAVAQLMPDAATVQLAIRYAGRLRRQHLAQRLAGVAMEKEAKAEQPEAVEEEELDYGHWGAESRQSTSHYPAMPAASLSEPYEMVDNRRPRKANPRPVRSRYSSSDGDDAGHSENVTNLSLVSSNATDEDLGSGLPLPDSELISQSLLANTSAAGARNPFRTGSDNRSNVSKGKPSALSGRGSEVFDSWKPKLSTGDVASTSLKQIQSSKKRQAAPIESKRKLKQQKPRKVKLSSAETTESAVETFMDWFDANRAMLEERYPDESADDLIRIARSRYKKVASKTQEETGNQENVPSDTIQEDLDEAYSKPARSKSSVNKEHTSKRLSSFKFESKTSE